jgi:hypothetical protein
MLEVEDNLRPFVARDPGDTGFISNKCSLKAKEGKQKNQLACCPACWGKYPCVCKFIYTVTALLSTNFVAECIISTDLEWSCALTGL